MRTAQSIELFKK